MKRKIAPYVNHKQKQVWKFDLQGHFVCEYTSANEAPEDSGAKYANILNVCRKKKGRAGQWQWRFANDL